MDRISALRNIEEALGEYEAGERDLESVERRVRAVVRTYATAFEGDLAAYRATGDSPADGLVVAAPSRQEARERVRELLDDEARFDVEPVAPGGGTHAGGGNDR